MKSIKFFILKSKIVSIASFIILITIYSCEKQDDTETTGSIKDYQIEVEVKNSQTQVGVGSVKVKLGARDTGINQNEFSAGCTNLGTKNVSSSGKTTFVAGSFAGEPEICDVKVYESSGSSISINDYYYNSQIRKVLIWIY